MAVLYGVTGVWAVTRGARAVADGLKQLDAGYTRIVTPAELAYVGALLLAAFARHAGLRPAPAVRAAVRAWSGCRCCSSRPGSPPGAVWAAVRGGLHPALWVLLFFGLVYVTVVALVHVLKVTRAERRARIVSP